MPRTPSENRPPSTALSPVLNWRGGSRQNYTTTKTSAHSPVGPEEWVLVSHLMRNRNVKQIAIDLAITANFALRAAVLLQTAVDKEVSAPSPTPAVAAPQATLPELPEPAVLQPHELTQKINRLNKEIAAGVLWSAPIWEIPQQIYDLSQIVAQASHKIARFS